MRVRLHSRAVKFLEKLDEKDKERIRLKLKSLVSAIDDAPLGYLSNKMLHSY
ncbi:MAG: hypothetical protein WAW37_19090 [Syntrophobacteraceae bacterium]